MHSSMHTPSTSGSTNSQAIAPQIDKNYLDDLKQAITIIESIFLSSLTSQDISCFDLSHVSELKVNIEKLCDALNKFSQIESLSSLHKKLTDFHKKLAKYEADYKHFSPSERGNAFRMFLKELEGHMADIKILFKNLKKFAYLPAQASTYTNNFERVVFNDSDLKADEKLTIGNLAILPDEVLCEIFQYVIEGADIKSHITLLQINRCLRKFLYVPEDPRLFETFKAIEEKKFDDRQIKSHQSSWFYVHSFIPEEHEEGGREPICALGGIMLVGGAFAVTMGIFFMTHTRSKDTLALVVNLSCITLGMCLSLVGAGLIYGVADSIRRDWDYSRRSAIPPLNPASFFSQIQSEYEMEIGIEHEDNIEEVNEDIEAANDDIDDEIPLLTRRRF